MEETLDLRQYLFIIRKWLWLFVLLTLIAGITAYVVSLNMTPIYRASVTLLIAHPDSWHHGLCSEPEHDAHLPRLCHTAHQ